MCAQQTEQVAKDYSYVDDFLRIRDEVVRLEGWTHSPDEMWCYVQPPGHLSRTQGWKIHLSATPRSAVEVLESAARVLLERRVAFKFAKALPQLRSLLSVRCSRGAGGKFITIYPDDDDQFRELVEDLHYATKGMEGPAILSDRRYQAESLVHYRYGGFSGYRPVLDADGSYLHMLVTPSGGWFEDKREAWYAPPKWAESPLPATTPERSENQRGKSKVLLDGRFVVFEAIRHSNRGGVYRAIDQESGKRVIVKEARPYVAAEFDGTDAQDFLRNEYAVLRDLEHLGIAVQPVSLFEHQGHIFLAEEEVSGQTLRAWVENAVKAEPDRVLPLESALPVARKLLDLVAIVHAQGFVFRDLTPNNVMVTPEDDLVLIDTEFVARPGDTVTRVMTMSYVAPEELTGPTRYPAPATTIDLYSLGASLFYLLTGVHPLLPEGKDEKRPNDDRLRFLVESVASSNRTLRAYMPIVLGLMRQDPDERWSTADARAALDASPEPAGDQAPARLTREGQRRLFTDSVEDLIDAMQPEDERNLWPTTTYDGRLFDGYSLQAGAAGPIDALRRVVDVDEHPEARKALKSAVRWLDHRLMRDPRVLPGLYFGRAGTYWALFEAAEALGEGEIKERALHRSKGLPVKWANPDITHGVAGAGMAQLQLWRHTRDQELAERVDMCVDSVLAARRETPEGVIWPLPESSAANPGGVTHYGFAHGVAGICTFLSTVAREFDRPELLQVAVEGGNVLVSAAQRTGAGALWSIVQPAAQEPDGNGVCWWCSGASGIGTFLIRLWRQTGDPSFLEYAQRAAVATRAEKWFLTTSHCHGLAGNGEFLLDMAAATGDDTYREWAEEHANCMYRLSVDRNGRLVPIDDISPSVTYSYNVGLCGAIGFLYRLRYGGSRWWMIDDFALAGGHDGDR